MKFLDLNGLTHFFGKVKTWAGNNYLSLEGGLIRGSVTLFGDYSLNIQETDDFSQRYVKIDYTNGISIGTHFDEGNETVDYVSINPSYISAPQFKKINGKSTQALIADGSVREIGSANGIAGLDSKGNVPLSQLGNLDTTVAEVVTALPTTNIKKHIYLIKDASGVTQNKYEEYIYTGDTSATYDASKWEKLGDFRATVDLANYYTKSQVDSIANGKSSTSHTHSVIINGVTKTIAASGGAAVNLGTYLTSHQSLAEYAKKSEAMYSTYVSHNPSNISLEFDDINGESLAMFDLEQVSASTAGVMIPSDKKKLDGISSGATADSAITTAEIDALFA